MLWQAAPLSKQSGAPRRAAPGQERFDLNEAPSIGIQKFPQTNCEAWSFQSAFTRALSRGNAVRKTSKGAAVRHRDDISIGFFRWLFCWLFIPPSNTALIYSRVELPITCPVIFIS